MQEIDITRVIINKKKKHIMKKIKTKVRNKHKRLQKPLKRCNREKTNGRDRYINFINE